MKCIDLNYNWLCISMLEVWFLILIYFAPTWNYWNRNFLSSAYLRRGQMYTQNNSLVFLVTNAFVNHVQPDEEGDWPCILTLIWMWLLRIGLTSIVQTLLCIYESWIVQLSPAYGLTKDIIVGVIYKPPNMNVESFVFNFSRILDTLNKENWPSYLLADYNIDLLKYNNHSESFLNQLLSYGFFPKIDRSTRITDSTETRITDSTDG